ncbi:RNA recognition motif-containing protein [Cryptotrichosporon argae]
MDDDFIPLDESDGAASASASTSAGSKARKPRVERENTTVFVSSLPYTATTTDLVTHFSFVGPIRHGFVATDRETGKSKGVGYVTYSLAEDAARAVAELDGGSFGQGRKIRVAWADKKPDRLERRDAATAVAAAPKPAKAAREPAAAADPAAIRTVVLSGLPEVTKAVLWKKVRKVDGSLELVFPVVVADAPDADAAPAPTSDTAHLVFPTHADALRAVPKLHGHVYKGKTLSAVLKKRLDNLVAKGSGQGPSHAGRLIVRNLAWDTTEHDLRAAFLPFGPIHSIDLPTAPSKLPASGDKPAPPRARGFAFVWFLARKDAERAVGGVNGIPLKTDGKGKDRPVAVDFALSKGEWEKAQGKEGEAEKVDAEDSGGESSEGSEGSDGGSDSEGEDDSDDEEAVSGSDEESEEAGGDADDDAEDAPVKPRLPETDVGSTLFIRNLPFEATEPELQAVFRVFGPLRYAKITIDKATGRSRGTGFACFWNTADADAAIAESERIQAETGTGTGANATAPGGGAAAPKNPFALPSVLQADPSAAVASKLVLHGRTLAVSRAVTREQAGHLAEDAQREREKGDKRNTYLMREGVIFPNSPAAALLPPAEVEKRQAAFAARRALLRSNPSLYISKTRLSIRQLPLFMTERTLKRLAIHAARAFDAEAAAGARAGLSRTEAADDAVSELGGGAAGAKPKRGERQTVVVQSKVVRATDKADPVTGAGRSKGYGFLELRTHRDALKVLRWANNNQDVGALVWAWWKDELKDLKERAQKELKANPGDEALTERVRKIEARLAEGDERSGGGMRGGKTLLIEFSIENVQVVKRRAERMSGGGQKRRADEAEDDGGAPKRPRVSGEHGERGARGARPDRTGDRGRGDKPRWTDGDDAREKRQRGRPTKSEAARPGAGAGAGPAGGKKTASAPDDKDKLGKQLGGLIGRKRRMRQGK